MMLYYDFKEDRLSRLGFGGMRLPVLENGEIDQALLERMVDYALERGINYFDTAYTYMSNQSEIALGKALRRHPRESYRFATKFPGHQVRKKYSVSSFEEQLRKTGLEYFDYYLLHNVNEGSVKVYEDPRWGIIDYVAEQKKNGRVRHLGFSCHAKPDLLEAFLDRHDGLFEFCQIQLNYLDWTLQDAERKYRILTERGIPVWVMESVRGGRLANLSPEENARLKALRPDESIASWGFRWLQGLPEAAVILSGMSNMEQLMDNVKTFSGGQPLSLEERQLLLDMAEEMKGSVPCTACRYCCEGCPMELDIPGLIATYNDMKFSKEEGSIARRQIENSPAEKRPSACIGCGQCAAVCPQGIDIPGVMRAMTEDFSKYKTWTEICEEIEAKEEAAKVREG